MGPVTYVKNGNAEKVVAVVANPQFKAVDMYGMDGRNVFVENAQKAEVSEKPVNGHKM